MPPPDPTPEAPPTEPAPKGLPSIAPDASEQLLADQIDNIVPSFGYEQRPMVGLGGSAGSLPALRAFFESMPQDSGFVVAVVLHLAPDHPSILAEMLQKWSSVPVVQVEQGMRVTVNKVYVIPPGKYLTCLNGHLHLSDLDREHGRRVAVDLFFRSLADTHGPHAAAIVLSGADGDGTLGIKRIKERGGLTIAQDPEEAEHDSMPKGAIATGMVDWVLQASEMPARLTEYFGREKRLVLPPEDGPQPAKGAREGADAAESALRDVLVFLRMRTGRDFTCYKRATILRRIARRMQVNAMPDVPSYLAFLRTHPGEAGALLTDLLISVTNFFRDRDAFAALEAYLPSLFEGKGMADAIRIWVPGCATGEEAYSIAMLLLEHARTLESPPAVQVFGCDLDDEAVHAARMGLYPLAMSADVSEDRLRRFFVKEHRGYRVRRELREVVLFAAHDLLKDAPFSKLDLISCRNLLIYLNREAQRRVLEIFHFALKREGKLFLGSSESVEEASPLFVTLDKKHRIYARRPTARVSLPSLVGPGRLLVQQIEAAASRDAHPAAPVVVRGSPHSPATSLALSTARLGLPEEAPRISSSELHFRLIERFAPPSVVVNADHEIQHLSERAGHFLSISGGEPSLNLLRLVNPALRLELRSALFRAAQTGEPAEAFRVPAEIDGASRLVDIRVSPAPDLAPDFLLVVFDAHPPSGGPAGEVGAVAPAPLALPEPILQQLEGELEGMKLHLRETVEQYEASTEELKASNEELQAMNEELRSATEELETSREELQSINEELTTVNQELKSKVDELGHANSDLQNLMGSTAIATLFLDREMRIMRFTNSAAPIFNLIPGDLGRPLSDLQHRIEYPEMMSDALHVLEKLAPIEREVSGAGGRSFLARTLPYRTVDDRIAGVVLTFVDVTERQLARRALGESEERYRTLFDSIDQGFCVGEVIFGSNGRAVDFRFTEVNLAFERHTGLREVIGRTVRELAPGHEDYWFDLLGRVAVSGDAARFEGRAEAFQRYYEVYAFRVGHADERVVAILFADMTARKRAEEAAREQMEDLARFNNVAVDRESRMIELKQEVNELRARLAEPPRYLLNVPPAGTETR